MRDFRSNRGFGGRDGGRPMMHQAICDNCGKNCEVPFQPTGEKPVYCNECFAAQGGRDGNRGDRGGYRSQSAGPRRFPSRDSGRPSFHRDGGSAGKDYSRDIAAINMKLDKIMKTMGIVEAPVEEKQAPIDEAPAQEALVQEESPMADDLIETEE